MWVSMISTHSNGWTGKPISRVGGASPPARPSDIGGKLAAVRRASKGSACTKTGRAGMDKSFITIALFLGLTGCATIISGKHQDVQVISSPHGAKACTNGQCITTPGSFTLRKDTNYVIVIEKDGYISETVMLTSGVGGAVAGNILLGGIIGGAVDMASGAAYKLYPETVNVALRSMPGAPGDDFPPTSARSPSGQQRSTQPIPQPVVVEAPAAEVTPAVVKEVVQE
jgi:hypothetical protein